MTDTKMTKKEMFAFIAETLADNADVVAFCENEIALLDRKAVKAKEVAAKKKETGDELRERVLGVLANDWMTIADVTAALNDEDVSTAKVTYRLNALVEAGLAEKMDVKAEPSESGRARTVKAFRLVSVEG